MRGPLRRPGNRWEDRPAGRRRGTGLDNPGGFEIPDSSHVGRRYHAPGQVIEPDAVRGFAAAVAGADRVPDLGPVPPTFAAVYCLFPTLGQLFFDEEVGLPLDGLVHGEQEFSFLAPVSPGDTVDASAEIAAVEEKRGRTFVTVRLEASRPDGTPVLSGRALLIATGSTS